MQSIFAFFSSTLIGIMSFFGIQPTTPTASVSTTTATVRMETSATTSNSTPAPSTMIETYVAISTSTKPLQSTIQRDKAKDIKIGIADPACSNPGDDVIRKFRYEIASNENRVIAENTLLSGVDGNSFVCVGYLNSFGDGGGFWESYFFKDKNSVYVLTFMSDDSTTVTFGTVKNADTKTFSYVGTPLLTPTEREISWKSMPDAYAKDATHVFSGSDIIPDFDPKTFQNLKSGYIKDKNHVGIFGVNSKDIPEADAPSFLVLGMGYAKDKNHIYYYGNSVEDADLATFSLDTENSTAYTNFAKDKNYRYKNGKRVTP